MGYGRSLLAVVALIASSFPGPVSGHPLPQQAAQIEQRAGIEDLLEIPTRTGIELRSLLRDQVELGDPNRITLTYAYPDVNRDGVKDVLEIDLDLRDGHPTYGFVGTLRLNTLNGKTGAVIGGFEMPFDSGVPDVYLTRLGEDAEPGAIVILNRFISTAEHPTGEFIAKGVSAAGKELWSREILSTYTSTPTRFIAATGVAVATDLLDAPEESTDLLVSVYDYAGAVLTLTPAIIDGTTGEMRQQLPITVPWTSTTPIATGTPDLDRDLDLGRRDDVLVIDTTGLAMGLLARSSSTGEEFWHNVEAPTGHGWMTAPVKDATGDATHDFVIGAPLRLVDGATGDIAWERSGGSVVVTVGRVDGDASPDVLTGSFIEKGNRVGVRVDVVSATGTPLGKALHFGKKPRDSNFTGWLFQATGDVNGDRIDDIFIWLLSEPMRHISVSGASGKSILESGALYPLMGSLTGSSRQDLADVVQRKDRFTIIPRSARGPAYWRTAVSAPADFFVRSVNAVGDSVVVTIAGRTGARTFAMDGQTGSIQWSRKLGS